MTYSYLFSVSLMTTHSGGRNSGDDIFDDVTITGGLIPVVDGGWWRYAIIYGSISTERKAALCSIMMCCCVLCLMADDLYILLFVGNDDCSVTIIDDDCDDDIDVIHWWWLLIPLIWLIPWWYDDDGILCWRMIIRWRYTDDRCSVVLLRFDTDGDTGYLLSFHSGSDGMPFSLGMMPVCLFLDDAVRYLKLFSTCLEKPIVRGGEGLFWSCLCSGWYDIYDMILLTSRALEEVWCDTVMKQLMMEYILWWYTDDPEDSDDVVILLMVYSEGCSSWPCGEDRGLLWWGWWAITWEEMLIVVWWCHYLDGNYKCADCNATKDHYIPITVQWNHDYSVFSDLIWERGRRIVLLWPEAITDDVVSEEAFCQREEGCRGYSEVLLIPWYQRMERRLEEKYDHCVIRETDAVEADLCVWERFYLWRGWVKLQCDLLGEVQTFYLLLHYSTEKATFCVWRDGNIYLFSLFWEGPAQQVIDALLYSWERTVTFCSDAVLVHLLLCSLPFILY